MLGLWLIVGLGVLAWIIEMPRRQATAMIAGAWLGIVALHAIAPASGLAARIGGSRGGWLLAGGLVALILLYRAGLRHLRARAAAPLDRPAPGAAPLDAPAPLNAPAPDDDIGDAELERYARHIVLREIGGPGQMRLRAARVLVVGAGGLGAPVCLYLAAAGVGRITLADDDRVSLSNLQRQVIFRSDQRGQGKVQAAAAAMTALNPHVAVTPLPRRITQEDTTLFADHDLIVDGTDSFAAREAINRAATAARIPLVSGAIAQWEGQVTLYDPARGGPCLTCLFPAAPAPGLAPACAEAGVVGALPGVIGSLMALEAIKAITGAGDALRGRMLIFDGLHGETRTIRTARRKDCPVCKDAR